MTRISDVDGGGGGIGATGTRQEAVGHNRAICSRRLCSVSAPLLALRLLARRGHLQMAAHILSSHQGPLAMSR